VVSKGGGGRRGGGEVGERVVRSDEEKEGGDRCCLERWDGKFRTKGWLVGRRKRTKKRIDMASRTETRSAHVGDMLLKVMTYVNRTTRMRLA
jgi:hypothetical protein